MQRAPGQRAAPAQLRLRRLAVRRLSLSRARCGRGPTPPRAMPDTGAVPPAEGAIEPPRPATVAEQLETPGYSAASRNLFDSYFGQPVVRCEVSRDRLLQDIRSGHVKAVHFFRSPYLDSSITLGSCLVEYTDGTVKQSEFPMEDVRMHYAMETHGVRQLGLPEVPAAANIMPPEVSLAQRIIEPSLAWVPLIGIVLMWILVQLREVFRGDFSDRQQMRKAQAKADAASKAAAAGDRKLINLQQMMDREIVTLEDVKRENSRLELGLSDQDLEQMMIQAQRGRKREEAGTWALAEEEEENVERRKAALARRAAEAEENPEEAEVAPSKTEEGDAAGLTRMAGVRIRRAKLRSVNRDQMKGRLKNVEDDEVYFTDVAGIADAKRELSEVVDFFNFPERFEKSGARAPRGVLLYGPPGTGKTLLARAVAGEAQATFFGVNASEFVEMFMGIGAARVRDLFATARENAPSVIFIDEIDAVGRARGGTQGNDEREQTLNQMLSEMDGFDSRSGVVVIAATNRRDVLDAALIRAGRFDRQVFVGTPGRSGRTEVFRVHLRERRHDNIDYDELAFLTDGYTGAMIASLCNLAALYANRAGRDTILRRDFLDALAQEETGALADTHSDFVTERVALVEAATALVATLLPVIEEVEAVTIAPTERRRLGQTMLKQHEPRVLTRLYTRRYLEAQLVLTLAGRAAERLKHGEEGVSSLQMPALMQARRVVNKLVLSAAMADDPRVGPRAISEAVKDSESGRMRAVENTAVSTAVREAADWEMERRMHEAEVEVRAIVARNEAALDALVHELKQPPMRLEGGDVRAIVKKHANADDWRRAVEEVSEFA